MVYTLILDENDLIKVIYRIFCIYCGPSRIIYTLPENSGQLLTYSVKEYVVNLKNHVYNTYFKLLKAYYIMKTPYKDSRRKQCQEVIEFFVKMPTIAAIEESYGQDYVIFYYDSFEMIMKNLLNIHKHVQKKKNLLEGVYRFLRVLNTYAQKKSRAMDQSRQIFEIAKAMYVLDKSMSKAGSAFSVVPLASSKAHHIVVDTDTLYDLSVIEFKSIWDKKSLAVIQRNGESRQTLLWKANFRIKQSLFTVVPNKWTFAYRVSTDGHAVTIHRKKWMIRNKKPNDDAKKVLALRLAIK
jgi:hypothetical protein